jgi:hypothetical protein
MGEIIMAALEWLWHGTSVDSKKFTKPENWILEAELYLRIHKKIWEAYKFQYKDYFYLIVKEEEDINMELYVIKSLINDLIKSEAYTLSGIAYYTRIPEEIIEDLFMTNKINPLITFTRKLIELHKSIRPDIYQKIIKKLISDKETK